MIYESVLELIGKTPIIRLDRLSKSLGIKSKLFGKAELFNPSGSSKDRAALYMLTAAEDRGELQKGGTVIIATSGNTGVGLSMIAAIKGYRVIITMPDNVGPERIKLLEAYGAVVRLTPSSQGMEGAVRLAGQFSKELPWSKIVNQFEDEANPRAHEETTAKEILSDLGVPDVFVATVGTGGTFSGTVRELKKRGRVHAIAVEPASSPLLSKGYSGKHGILGIGPNFIPSTLDRSLIDEVAAVTDGDAREMMMQLARTEGLLCGISSGAAIAAAVQASTHKDMENKTILVLLPDTGERYLSGM